MFLSIGTLGKAFFIAAFAAVVYLMFRILQPFLLPLFVALVLFTLLDPFYRKLLHRLRGRRNLSAAIVCVGLTVVLIMPLVLLGMALVQEAGNLYARLSKPETVERLRGWAASELEPWLGYLQSWLPAPITSADLWTKITGQAQDVGLTVLGGMVAGLGEVANFVLSYFIVIFGLFFLLRDSSYFASSIRKISPLDPREEEQLVHTFRQVSKATFVGSVVTALLQGVVSGMIYLLLGIPNVVLWGTLTGLASLVPIVGSSVIWIPLTIYLGIEGAYYKAAILAVLQIVIVSSIDNVVRPFLIEGRVRMHVLTVFFSILGGIAYFGILGVILGPLVFAIGFTFFELLVSRQSKRDSSRGRRAA